MENNCKCQPNLVTRKDLQIFRGTLAEVMKQPTVNMKIYLAWDKQQIFVGNNHGVKTPYNGQYKVIIKKYLSDFRLEIYDKLDERAKALVDEALEGTKKEIIQTLTNEFKGTISEIVKEDTKDIQTQIDTNKEGISSLNTNITNLETEINKIPEIERNVNANVEQINTLDNKVNSLKYLSYKTGIEISELANDIPNFKPVFCIENYDIYKIGRIYYVENGEIKVMAVGSGKKETIDAQLGLSITPVRASIPMKKGTVSFTLTPSVGNSKIISKYIFDGKETTTLPDAKIVLVDCSSPKKTTVTLSAVTIPSDDEYEYTANSVSETIEVYQPWFFGNENNLKQYVPDSKNFSNTIEDGEILYLYATRSDLTFQFGGVDVPAESVEDNILYSFEGVSATYTRYNFGVIHDTTITIFLKEQEV